MRDENRLIITYLTLRKLIGILGIALPFILFFGALLIFQTGIQSSISSYYHTGMRDLFVGTICVIGFFLLIYKGYESADNIAGDIGCLAAIGLALFPTAPDGVVTGTQQTIGYLHLGFAALFFMVLIYFALFLFTKTDPEKTPTPKKLQRNRVYRICGYTMAGCILLIVVYFMLPAGTAASVAPLNPVYWLEAIAIIFFGISWITKGEAILKDKNSG
jgi:hypothetical protein